MITTEFLLTSLVVVLIPGTGVIYTVSAGIFQGRRAAVAAAFGCTAGIIPHLLASISGLSLLLHTSAVAFQAVKLAGTAYLLYLAWSMWRNTGGLTFKDNRRDQGMRQVAIRGLLINILNPKLSIFFLAFLPQFISADAVSPLMQMFVLSGIFMGMTLFIFILYGLFANHIRGSIVGSPRMISRLQRSFAAVIAFFGVRLALAER